MKKHLRGNTTSSESDPEDLDLTGSSMDKPKMNDKPVDSDDRNSKEPHSQDTTPIQSLRAKIAPIVRGLRGTARFLQRHNPFRHDKRSKKIHPQNTEHPASSQSWRVGNLFCILPHESDDDESRHTCVYTVRPRLPDQYHGPMVRLNRDTGTSSESEQEEFDLMGSSISQSQKSGLSPPSESPNGEQAMASNRLKDLKGNVRQLEPHLSCPRLFQEQCHKPRSRQSNDTIISSKSAPVDLGKMSF